MSDIDKLRKAFDHSFIVEDPRLIENFEDGSSMRRDIIAGTKFLIVRIDPNKKALFPYFNRIEGIHKMCDYFLFVEDNDAIFVFIIEMKKGHFSPQKQLDLSENFIKFVLRRMCLIDGLRLEGPFFIRKIGISDIKHPKRQLKVGYDLYFDENNYLKRYHESKFRTDLFTVIETKSPNKGAIDLMD